MSYRIKGSGNKVDVEITGVNGTTNQLVRAFETCKQGCDMCPAAGAGNLTSFTIDSNGEGVTLHLRSKEGTRLDTGEIAQCVEFAVKLAETV